MIESKAGRSTAMAEGGCTLYMIRSSCARTACIHTCMYKEDESQERKRVMKAEDQAISEICSTDSPDSQKMQAGKCKSAEQDPGLYDSLSFHSLFFIAQSLRAS